MREVHSDCRARMRGAGKYLNGKKVVLR